MDMQEYLVMKRTGHWWVTLEGARRGPYVSRQVAIDSAIHSAKLDFKAGNAARVSLDEPEDGVPVVFETGT